MKKILFVSSVMLLTCTANAQTKKVVVKAKPAAAVVKPFKNGADSLSYAFGISLGEYLKSQGVKNLNMALLNKAIDQSIKGQKTYFDFNEANVVMSRLAEAKTQKLAATQKAEGKAFLAANKTKPNIVQTPSGLQYEVITKGTGAVPKLNDTIIAHYKGSLLNGKEFDNSYNRGEPITISVGGVIPGWTEALQLMPVGSKWKLYIPSSIGYGDYGAGSDIPAGATLIFEVELIGIKNTQ